MITVGSTITTKTLWALDQEDIPREVRITPEFEMLIKSQRDHFGFDGDKPVTIYSDTVDVLFVSLQPDAFELHSMGVSPDTISATRIFTTEKGARESVKARRKLKELDDSFDALPDKDAFIKDIIKTQLDLSVLDSKTSRIMKKWLDTPTKK